MPPAFSVVNPWHTVLLRGAWLILLASGSVRGATDYGDYSAFGSAGAEVVDGLRIGALTDTEESPFTNSAATGDDLSGVDDEDGVTLPVSVVPGASSSLTVNVTNTTGATALLNVWIDFNGNGLLTDTGERVASNVVISNGTVSAARTVNFTVPVTAYQGQVGVRVRLSSAGTSSSTGVVANGEVEDHLLLISMRKVDVVILMDQGSSIGTTDFAQMKSSVDGIIDRVLADNPQNRIAVVHYAGKSTTPPTPQLWIESDFSSDAAVAKNFQWRATSTEDPGTLHNGDEAHGAVGSLGRALDLVADTSIISPVKTLTRSPDRPLIIFLATDAKRGAGTSWLVNPASSTVGTAAAFQNYNQFKSARAAQFVCWMVGGNAQDLAAAAAIASTGGSYAGSVEANPADPQGNAASPRRLTATSGFSLTPSEMDAVAFQIYQAADNVIPVTDYSDYAGLPIAGSIASQLLRLGSAVDPEFGATLSASATGDDLSGIDDEDAVTVPASVTPGSSTYVTVNVTNLSGAMSYLNVWVDFNGNGSLDDAGERQVSNLVVANNTNAATRTVSFTIPLSATPGNKAVRARLTSVPNPGPYGVTGVGEVEDRLIAVVANGVDYGDYTPFPSASSYVVPSLKLGATTDTELAASTDATASGDDVAGIDDEDAVTLSGPLFPGVATSLVVSATNTSSSPAYLNAWVDFNRNGSLADSGEQVATNVLVATGTGNGSFTLPFTTPLAAVAGPSAIRVRLTTVASPGPDGLDGTGEVEDHAVTILQPAGSDFGDALVFPAASQTVSTDIRIGTTPTDAESSTPTSGVASGDDTTGVDDEDLIMPSVGAGGSVVLSVPVHLNAAALTGNTARLGVFVDWNGDGDVSDANETLPAVTVSASGVSTFILSPPESVAPGAKFLRLRLVEGSTAPAHGGTSVFRGEVEDYVIQVTPRNMLSNGSFETVQTGVTFGSTFEGSPASVFGGPAAVEAPATWKPSPAADGTLHMLLLNDASKARDGTKAVYLDDNDFLMVGLQSGQSHYGLNTAMVAGQQYDVSFWVAPYTANLDASGNLVAGSTGNQRSAKAGGVILDQAEANLIHAAGIEVPASGSWGALRWQRVTFRFTYAAEHRWLAIGGGVPRTGDSLSPGGMLIDDVWVTPATGACGIGNLVWNDLNDTGYKATSELGADGVTLSLNFDANGDGDFLDAGEADVLRTTTGLGRFGFYSFGNLPPGRYQVTIPAPPPWLSLVASVANMVDDDVDNDNNATQRGGAGGPIESVAIMLSPGENDNTKDIALRGATRDYGDLSTLPWAASQVSARLFMGTYVDAELSNQGNSTATGDDDELVDDEDGVTLPSTLPRGAPVTISVRVTNQTSYTAYLNAWIDYNQNGLLTDSGEQIITNSTVASGSSASLRSFTFTVPASAALGNTGLRVRLTSASSPGTSGLDDTGEVEDYLVNISSEVLADYGDHSGFPSASQIPSADIRIGSTPTDGEAVNPTSGIADADDLTGVDDEDLSVPIVTAGQTSTLVVPVQINSSAISGGVGRLRVFVDWNGDGDVLDTNETLTTQSVTASGSYNFALSPPASTAPGTKFLRVRLTEGTSSPAVSGFSWAKGEVEDYAFTLLPPATLDYGDYSAFPIAGSTMVNTLRIGATTDVELSPTTNSLATGDDLTGSDDEDGLVVPAGVAKLGSGFVTVIVTNTSGASAYLNVWVDFDNDGDLSDAGEQVAVNLVIPTGTSAAERTVNFTVPASAVVGAVGVRARLTSVSSPGFDGEDGNGEVEDALINIQPAIVNDFGDNPAFPQATQLASSDVRMGTNPTDAEASNPTVGVASLDDTSGVDDEDVVLPNFFAGSETWFEVPVTLNKAGLSGGVATIRAFADWNADGDASDAGEMSAAVTVGTEGTSVVALSLSPPLGTGFGTRSVRLRIAEGTEAPQFGGDSAAKGEVEDHVVTMFQDGFVYGVSRGKLYEVKTSDGSSLFAANLIFGNSWGNGSAYMEHLGAAGVVAYSSGEVGDGRLAVWDRATGVSNLAGDLDSFGVPANATVHNGTCYNGFFWFIIEETDDLWRVKIEGSSGAYFITSATRISDIWNNARGHDFGDIVARPDGTVLAIAVRMATWQKDYFAFNLNDASPKATLLSNPSVMHNGIALRLDGRLYGGLGTLAENKDWFELNPQTGQSTRFIATGAVVDMTDLGIAVGTPAPVLSRTDYGDYPGYPAAGQVADSAIQMGTIPTDGDPTSPPAGAANGDDLSNVDDEDLEMPDFIVGVTTAIEVPVVLTGGITDARIGAWVDWNGDGDVADLGETLPAVAVAATGTAYVNLTPPQGTSAGTKYLRLRITAGTTAPAFSGVANVKGEVEDYAITVLEAIDHGDFSPFPSARSVIHNSLRIGALTDAEAIPVLNITATGDDVTGADDEDGVAVSAVMAHSGPGVITANVTNQTGTTAYLNVWVDFNGNGSLTDSGEHVGVNIAITSGTVAVNRTINFTVPADAALGVVGVRVRLTNESSPGPDGLDGFGEVEDNVTNLQTLLDFGDHLPFAAAAQQASRDAYLGAVAADAERANPTTGLANADDLADTDDEDLSLPTLMVGQPVAIQVPVVLNTSALGGGTATLRIFADWNGDGDANDAGETQPARAVSASGLQSFTLTPPVGTSPGLKYIRFRLSEGASVPAFSGVSMAKGEVEDVTVLVVNPLTIGNLVFDDRNYNGVADAFEGINGITVRLYREGQIPGVDAPVAEQITSGGGLYRFQALFAGRYFVHIPASQFSGAGLLRGYFSVLGTVESDDHLGEDGIDSAIPQTTGISSAVINLQNGTQPTAATGETGMNASDDDLLDSDGNLTIDFGFSRRVGIGNLVFRDADGNGVASTGEGVNGVAVDVYDVMQTPGVDAPVASTVTANGGFYIVNGIIPGAYRVHIPARMFRSGGPLFGLVSIAEGNEGDDDVGENGLNHTIPEVDGVLSNVVFIDPGAAPTAASGETGLGSAEDDDVDAAIDLTIDFGFQVPMGIGNLVFIDGNGNGVYNAGEGVGGVEVELYHAGDEPGYVLPYSTVTTAANGRYRFDRVPSGRWFVHIPAENFQFGGPLQGYVSISGVESELTSDDSVGENGYDSPSPDFTGISSGNIVLSPGGQPLDSAPGAVTGENGFNATEDTPNDSQFDLTIDFGFRLPDPNAVGVGNLVFDDANGNGVFDEGEGVDNVSIQVFKVDGSGNLLSNNPIKAVTTSAGVYYIGDLAAGFYRVHLPASNFYSGRALAGRYSLPGQGGDNGRDDDVDENGEDVLYPWLTGVWSGAIELSPGTEPTDEGQETGKASYMDSTVDANVDLTVDFGFYRPVGVGNMVFIDSNRNGRADAGEGVGGVPVRLFAAGMNPQLDAPLATTTTSSSDSTRGSFLFTSLRPGYYFLHIPASAFQLLAPLAGRIVLPVSVADGDDNVGQNGLAEGDPRLFGVKTGVFALLPGQAPAGTAEAGLFGTYDDNANGLVDNNVDLTQDFGFASGIGIGNLVFLDVNGDGIFDPSFESGLAGVPVELYSVPLPGSPTLVSTTTTNYDGLYSFFVNTGTYFVKIPARAFQSGGALHTGRSSPDAGQPTGVRDDDQAEDGVDDNSPEVNGISSASLLYVAGLQPTATSGEKGYGSQADDGADADSNLTIDFGIVFGSSQRFAGERSTTMAQLSKAKRTKVPSETGANLGTDLLSYALGLEWSEGLVPTPPFQLVKNVSGGVDAVVLRPVVLPPDVRYRLEGAAFGSTSWSALVTSPTVTYPGDGRQHAVYERIDAQSLFQASEQGQVRLVVELDADLNGIPEETASTASWGFAKRRFPVGQSTFGMPLLAAPVYSGTVKTSQNDVLSVKGVAQAGIQSVLEPGREYYIQITDGVMQGHRLEVNEAASSASDIVLLGDHPRSTLQRAADIPAGSRVALRPHWMLEDLAPASRFRTGQVAAVADNIHFFRDGIYETWWAGRSASGAEWFAPSGAAQEGASRVIGYGEGFMIHPRSAEISLTLVGEVSSSDMAVRLQPGSRMLGGLSVAAVSMGELKMNAANGFVGGDASTGDRLRFWLADQPGGPAAYVPYYLDVSGHWLAEDAPSQPDPESMKLFQPWRSAILIQSGNAGFRVKP